MVETSIGQALVHAGFLRQADRHPNAVAIVDGGIRISYGDLLQRSLHFSNLISRSVEDSSRPIAVIGDKSHRAIEAILAVLLSGRPYSFLNPMQRRPRIQRMVDTLRPALLVDVGSTEIDHSPEIVARGIPILRLPTALPEGSFDSVSVPSGAAYVLFTSGSTGEPKGVVVGHEAAVASQREFLQKIRLSVNDVVAGEAPLNFDVSVFDIFAPLCVGASLALIPDHETDPLSVLEILERMNVTSIFTVPSLVQQILESVPDASRRLARISNILMTGELISARLAKQAQGLIGYGCSLWNLYGATEFPWGLARHLALSDLSRPNVLERSRLDAPVTARMEDSGELSVSGVGLSSGYVTAQTDYRAPFAPLANFATGDFAEPLSNDRYHLLGRRDRQIRRGGYRIELREVENWIETHPFVRSCFAIYLEKEEEIIVYVLMRSGASNLIDDGTIGTYASTVLPDYMLPNRFVALAEMPQTMSGKKDYTQLPRS